MSLLKTFFGKIKKLVSRRNEEKQKADAAIADQAENNLLQNASGFGAKRRFDHYTKNRDRQKWKQLKARRLKNKIARRSRRLNRKKSL